MKSIAAAQLALILPLILLGQFGCASCPPAVDVRTLGAVGNGIAKDTAAFQKAIDDCSASGGGTVRVPAGNYLIGSIALKSNVTLRLEKDSVIEGSPDLSDYPLVKARWEGRFVDAYRGLISAQDAHHIAVIGPGAIIGNPKLGGRQMPRRPCVIEPINCDGITLEDFSATQSRMWTIHPTCCTNILARNLTIRTTTGNGDGIDVDSCRHVRIEFCDIDTGDDCIALKSGRGMEAYTMAKPTEDVLISHCTLGDRIFACIGVGSETSGGIRNVQIEHCNFTHANTFAIYIKSRPGRGAFIDDITARDLDVTNAKGGFLRINLLSSGIQDAQPVPGDAGIPSAKNYRFTNVRISDSGALTETSISPAKPLIGFTLADITGQCQKGISLSNVTHQDVHDIHVTIVPSSGRNRR